MKRILLTLIFLAGKILSAQPLGWQSQFDKFISSPSIYWASYVFDTVRIKDNKLNSLLFSRFDKNEIRGSLYLWLPPKDNTHIIYKRKNDLDSIMFSPRGMPVLDSNGNELRNAVYAIERKADLSSVTKTDIKQILYIENGKLKNYIPWVSPMIPIITGMGVNLGDGGYFSTCFNFNRNYIPRKKDNNIYLSETRLVIKPDSLDARDRLKELYGKNFIEILWPYIENGEFEVFTTDTNARLKKEEITDYIQKKTAFPTPVYDTNGNITNQISFIQDSFYPKKIIKTELVQDWYYNYKDNIVFNHIKELLLFVKNPSSEEESIPVLKIVFN